MKIAITSQNAKSVTAHAGRCRKFWVYELSSDGADIVKQFVELEMDETLHTMQSSLPPKLAGIDVLITANLGESLRKKLTEAGITTHLLSSATPDIALLNYLADERQPH